MQGDQQYMQTIKALYFNLRYRLEASSEDEGQQHGVCWLLGKRYDLTLSHQLEQFHKRFESVLWLSYRYGIKHVGSDTGWGCAIRVGQMVLANALRTLLGRLHGGEVPIQSLLNLVLMFVEDEDNGWVGPYSLQKFVKLGDSLIGYRAGEWLSTLHTSSIMQAMTKGCGFRGAGKFQVRSYNQMVSYTGLAQAMTGRGQCECWDRARFCQHCETGSRDRSVLVLVSTVLAVDCIPKSKYQLVRQLMAADTFMGAMGGKQKKALYLVGYEGDNLYYLDPHYTKEEVHRFDRDKLLSDFSCKQRRRLNIRSLRPSLTFSYLLRELADLKGLVAVLEDHMRSEHAFVYLEEERRANPDQQSWDTQQQIQASGFVPVPKESTEGEQYQVIN